MPSATVLPTPAANAPGSPAPWGWSQGVRYGLLGLPLAFCALPLYVVMPHWYATTWGVPLASLGVLLLVLRLFDAVLDPWIGRACDAWARAGTLTLWRALALAAGVLALAFAALFYPQVAREHALAWAGVSLAFTYLAYSVVTVAHQSWGAALGGDARMRSTIVAWREGWGLLGVVLASTVPIWLGVPALGALMAVALLLAVVALRFAPRPDAARVSEGASETTPTFSFAATPAPTSAPASAPSIATHAKPQASDLFAPWRNPAFVRLVAVFAANGIASAVPATLVLFFIADRLQAPTSHQGAYLGLYFLCAAVSMPLWLRAVARWGLARAWGLGMGLSIAAFVGAAAVGAGDAALYAVVCAASGLALGSDLAIPAALLAQVAQPGANAERADHNTDPAAPAGEAAHGLYFGWWNLVAKLNLALAAGLTLPLLAALGYTPGARDADSLFMLSAVYCLLPCALKAGAALALHRFFIRNPDGNHHAP
ncbi:MFS transporter [Acidovorax temperans]|uniref:MFS transporter n=1 Tax=Acidovorax temperans TaxID=80878 RepID=UPI0035AEA26A